jgi:hypothetical protein
MLSRIFLLAGALCLSSYALAAAPSIGSVTARGETRVDNYDVRGSGTVFDGSVIETGQSISSGADLRLTSKAVVTVLRDSRGTLYRDHFVLQRGEAQLGLTDSFRIQANGVVVVPAEEHSSGTVSIDSANAVTVEAKNGTLEIRNSVGATVARVRPGHPLTFSSLADKSSAEFSALGTVSLENGRYYLNSSETGTKYEVKGDNLQNYDGTSVVASGVLEAAAPAAGIAGVLLANSIQSSNAGALLAGQSAQAPALIRGFSVTKGVTANTVCTPVRCCPNLPTPVCCTPLPTNECGPSN